MSNKSPSEENPTDKEWKKNKPPKLTPIVQGYGLRQSDLIKSLNTFNKATFSDSNEEIKKSIEWTKYLVTLIRLAKTQLSLRSTPDTDETILARQ